MSYLSSSSGPQPESSGYPQVAVLELQEPKALKIWPYASQACRPSPLACHPFFKDIHQPCKRSTLFALVTLKGLAAKLCLSLCHTMPAHPMPVTPCLPLHADTLCLLDTQCVNLFSHYARTVVHRLGYPGQS